MDLYPALRQLAEAYGIAVEFWDWQGKHVDVPAETIVKVLAALDVDASTPEAAERAVQERGNAAWRRMLPPSMVIREGWSPMVDVHVRHGEPVSVWIDLEAGGTRSNLHQQENWAPPRELDGRLIGQATFQIPGDLPLGYHTLKAHSAGDEAAMTLIVTPAWVGFPDRMGDRRVWGIATQLYSVRSAQVLGRRRRRRPGGPRGVGRCGTRRRVRPGQPACTPPSRPRRWNHRRTCRPPGASRTRCTCGWNGFPSTPTLMPPPAAR